MAFLKNDKLMLIRRVAKENIFLDNVCLKEPLVLKMGMFFLTQETQKLHQKCPKTYWY